jgi:hypothetical protein
MRTDMARLLQVVKSFIILRRELECEADYGGADSLYVDVTSVTCTSVIFPLTSDLPIMLLMTSDLPIMLLSN